MHKLSYCVSSLLRHAFAWLTGTQQEPLRCLDLTFVTRMTIVTILRLARDGTRPVQTGVSPERDVILGLFKLSVEPIQSYAHRQLVRIRNVSERASVTSAICRCYTVRLP